MTQTNAPDHDVVIIGAGVTGIYQLYRIRQLGLRVVVLERAADVGGTWYRNRYPGARFDSESVTYGYSFSEELLQEWNWSERFAGRAETERYLRHVVRKFDLRKDMRFQCDVAAARWDEASRRWSLTLSGGETLTTRFLMTAVGLLSEPTLPRYKGVDRFQGTSFHTYYAPEQPIDYTGRRVAVIGTGATGVQVISELADKVGQLTVFQRRPNWCAPLGNGPISADEMAQIKRRYREIFETCRKTPSGFVHDADPRKTLEVPPEEREAFWERLYAEPGFGVWLGNFRDILFDPDANAEFSRFVARKIRERVRDPAVAEKLIPKDHGFGTRRVPLETRYYEAYNRPNVRLVDLNETPIEEITALGIRTSAEELEVDVIIYATGFDAITGSFDRIDIVGSDGLRLKDKWHDGPLTTFGLMSRGFPNLITVAGPQSGSVATNFPRGIEEAVDWCTGLLEYMRDRSLTRLEPKQATEDEWVAHVRHQASRLLLGQQKSWFTGYNSNLDREYKSRNMIYAGGALRYREILGEQTATGYAGLEFA